MAQTRCRVRPTSAGQPLDLQTTDGTTSMWIVDGIGSTAAAIADTGKTAYTVSYDPYGAETVGIGGDSAQWQQNPYGFKSGLRSSGTDNGLTEFGYRWESSVTGGWIERDTLDAPLSPSNANRYAYAADDAINSSDPTGAAYCSSSVGCYSTPDGTDHYGTGPHETHDQIVQARWCFIDYATFVGGLAAAEIPAKLGGRLGCYAFSGYSGARTISGCF